LLSQTFLLFFVNFDHYAKHSRVIVQFSWVRYTLQQNVLGGCRPAGRGFNPHRNSPLEMVRKTVPDDRSGNAENSFAEFRCCSRHGQIITLRRTETGSARQIRRRYMQTC